MKEDNRPKNANKKEVKPKKKRFHFYMQKKLAVLYILVLLAFVGLGIRMIWIAREKGIQYNKEILQQQSYDSTTLPYKRGSIVDAKGTPLAVSEKYYNLVIDAEIIVRVILNPPWKHWMLVLTWIWMQSERMLKPIRRPITMFL